MAMSSYPAKLQEGTEFTTFQDLYDSITSYQSENFVHLFISHSRTVEGARKRSRRFFLDKLIYTEIIYTCAHGRRRSHSKVDIKDCPFVIKVNTKKDGTALCIRSIGAEHNHVINKEAFSDHLLRKCRLPYQKFYHRLNTAERKVAANLLKTKANKKLVQQTLRQQIGKLVTLSDLHSIVDDKEREEETERMRIDDALIAAIRHWPVLYNKEHPLHQSEEHKNRAWDSIAQEVGVEAPILQKRWINFKRYYFRITQCEGDPEKVKSRLCDKLKFLSPLSTKEESQLVQNENGLVQKESQLVIIENNDDDLFEGDVEEIPDDDGEDISMSEIFSSGNFNTITATPTTIKHSPHHNQRKRKIRNVSDRGESEIVEDPNELFFRSLLPFLKRLDDLQSMKFRTEVQSLLLKYLKPGKKSRNKRRCV